MKNVLKTSLVAGSLLAFGFAVMSGINPANTVKAEETATPTTGDYAQVILTVKKGDLDIGLSGTALDQQTGLNLTPNGLQVSNNPQYLTGSFGPESFWISDQAGTLSGYYTTLSVTNLSGVKTPSNAIPASNVKLMASGTIATVSGESNADVTIPDFTTWTTADGSDVKIFFHREDVGAGILGVYATDLAVAVTVPAHTVADTYKGTITYTLYDLDPEVAVAQP